MNPPRLKHIRYKKTDDRKELVAACAAALHMSKGERAVLSYYSRQSNGFCPALQAIANATGQNRSQVYRNREALVKHGIIALTGGNVVVDWDRIRLFSALDPKMTKKNIVCLPVDTSNRFQARTMKPSDFDTMEMDRLIFLLARMSPSEYHSLRSKLSKGGKDLA